jgi:hypothetical protein
VGCVLPGTQQRVGAQKIKGVKSEGKICTAYEVGWLGDPTDEFLLLEESWGMISGDVCPMAPPAVRMPVLPSSPAFALTTF